MATAKSSIAGRAHGATPKAPEPTGHRYYPQLSGKGDPEMVRAMTTAYDFIHELRSQVATLTAAQTVSGAAETAKGSAGGSQDSKGGGKPAVPFNDNIGGIKVKAPTDSSTLQNGFTIRYSTESGQFEFGM